MPGHYSPTCKENPDFDAEAAAEKLKGAMKGLGTTESEIIEVLVGHSLPQRLEIKDYYKQAFGEDLVDDLKSELGGHFEDVCVALLVPPRLYDAKQIKKAISGAGTTESTLIEILCARTDEEITEIKEKYAEETDGGNLEDDIKGDTSGHLEKLFVSLLCANRENGNDIDDDQAREDAQALFDAGEGTLGTDESTFNQILCTRNYNQLRRTFECYANDHDKHIIDVIKSECTGTLETAYNTIVKFILDEQLFYAERIEDALKGIGTDDEQLIRLVVGRSEIDMGEIKEKYELRFERTLADAISGDCSGDYKKILLGLIGE